MNHTALTTPAGTPNLVNPTREPCPFTITFPSIEVALAELGQKVFGATIVIAERPAPPPTPPAPAKPRYRLLEDGETILPTDQWINDGFGGSGEWEQRQSVMPGEILNLATAGGDHTPHRRLVATPAPNTTPSEEMAAWMDAYRRRGEDIDKLLGEKAAFEAEAQRLHAHWHEAATEVTTLRDEVKRLANMLDKAQRYTHTQLVEIRQWETRFEREQMCHAACGVIAMADTRGSATKARDGMHPDYCSASVKDVIRRVDECIELREEVKSLREALAKLETAHPEKDVSAALAPAPTYRLLEVGEVLLNTDEFNYTNGGWDASQEAGYKVSPSSVGRYRRKITPA